MEVDELDVEQDSREIQRMVEPIEPNTIPTQEPTPIDTDAEMSIVNDPTAMPNSGVAIPEPSNTELLVSELPSAAPTASVSPSPSKGATDSSPHRKSSRQSTRKIPPPTQTLSTEIEKPKAKSSRTSRTTTIEGRSDMHGLRYTSIRSFPFTIGKSASSAYARTDAQSHVQRSTQQTVAERKVEGQKSRWTAPDTIAIHPGSRLTRIPLAPDDAPKKVPSVLARRSKTGNLPYSQRLRTDENATLSRAVTLQRMILRDRQRVQKIRPIPVASQTMGEDNLASQPEWVEEECQKWTDARQDLYAGSHALKLVHGVQEKQWAFHWLFSYNGWNLTTSNHPDDFVQYLQIILKQELNISPQEYKKFNIIFIVPDNAQQGYIEFIGRIFLSEMGFHTLAMQQESICSTFGADIPSACVVDIGATSTSICCVEEGFILPETRMTLAIGGDDLSELFLHNLKQINFPWKDCELNLAWDKTDFDEIKESCLTLQEHGININEHSFDIQRPGQSRTQRYTFNMYEEGIITAMALFKADSFPFRPFVTSVPRKTDWGIDLDIGSDVLTQAMVYAVKPPESAAIPSVQSGEKANGNENLTNGTQKVLPETAVQTQTTPLPTDIQTEVMPAPTPVAPEAEKEVEPSVIADTALRVDLEAAISYAILASGSNERATKFAQSILLVGGCANIPGFNTALESRLSTSIPKVIPHVNKIQVVAPLRPIDVGDLAWKGIAHLAKFEIGAELMVRAEDWDILGIRAFKDRCFFMQ